MTTARAVGITDPCEGADIGALIAAARREGEASVSVFRTLLDTLARPGTVRSDDGLVDGTTPPALVPALVLADVGLRVAVVGAGAPMWSEVLRAVTGAVPASVPTSGIVVALRPPEPAEVEVLERGDALHPELGARLVLACRSLREVVPGDRPDREAEGGGTTLRLVGPGIPDERTLRVRGIAAEVFESLALANDQAPAGVDVHLVADDGQVAGLPRSTSITVVAEVA